MCGIVSESSGCVVVESKWADDRALAGVVVDGNEEIVGVGGYDFVDRVIGGL